MPQESQALDTLKEIKQIMERSSRFISLSGLSGIAAGICALTGAWFAHRVLNGSQPESYHYEDLTLMNFLQYPLIVIALLTLCAAVVIAFLFTYIKSRKDKSPLWGIASRRLVLHLSIPLLVGALLLFRLLQLGYFDMLVPLCLAFYGLALVNGSKYTLSDITYLGYAQILIGLVSAWFPEPALLFWAFGFGVLHIIYGAAMWWKYEKK